MRIGILPVGVLVLGGCLTATDGGSTGETTGRVASELYVQPNTRWTTRSIPTCVDPVGVPADYATAARQAANDTWQTESAVAFTACDSQAEHLRVELRTGQGQSFTQPSLTYGTQADSVGVFIKATPPELLWAPTAPEYRAAAARAFGFGLGFVQEDFRPDSPCAHPTVGGTTLGPFDLGSVMTACPVATNTWLSATDIDGLQRYYGPSTPMSAGSAYGGTTFFFARGKDNVLYQNWWNGSAWVWLPHERQVGGAPTVLTIDGAPHVFVREMDGTLGERFWTGSAWVWNNHGKPIPGGVMGTPAAVLDFNGEPHVFVRGADRMLYDFPPTGGWSLVGGPVASDPAAVLQRQRLGVFAKSGTRSGWMAKYFKEPTGPWLGGQGDVEVEVRSAPVAQAFDGVAHVWFRSNDDSLWELRFYDNWAARVQHDGVIRGMPTIMSRASVFVRGSDDQLWERWSPDGATNNWFWRPHGGQLGASPTASMADGTRRIFVRNATGFVEERYSVNGGWYWGVHPNGSLP